jgi:hypothetical protein
MDWGKRERLVWDPTISPIGYRDKDPFYIFLQKLAGATNTTVINLLSPPDVETRALRAGAIVEARKQDTKDRLDRIREARQDLRDAVDELTREESKLGESLGGEEVVKTAKHYQADLKEKKNAFVEWTENVQRIRDYVVINRAFTIWVRAGDDVPDYNERELVEALDNRLKSFPKNLLSIEKSPGLRMLDIGSVENGESATGIREQAKKLFDSRESRRDRKNDVVFLGLWILYETRSQISESLAPSNLEAFGNDVNALFDVLSGAKSAPARPSREFVFAAGPPVNFSTATTDLGQIRLYAEEKLLSYYPKSGPGVQTVLETLRGTAEQGLVRAEGRMIEVGVEALIFNRNLPKPIGGLPGVATLREQSGDAARRMVARIEAALEQLVNTRNVSRRDIETRVAEKKRDVMNKRDEIERLLEPRPEGLEPVIPYRPEGTWAMDSMFTGWVPLAPIVVYGIEQAYQLVADHVPRLAATDPSNENQIKKAVEVLQTNPRYRAYFVQIVARQMGLSRQAFNVRWMPDLTGDHMRVIMYNMRKLRENAGRNVDVHFRRALRVM